MEKEYVLKLHQHEVTLIVDALESERERASKMKMTDAQMVAIQNLKDAIDTLRLNNIRLYYDGECEQLIAFNYNNSDDSYIGYAPEMEEDYQSVYDFHETIVSLGYIGCGDTLGMKFKK